VPADNLSSPGDLVRAGTAGTARLIGGQSAARTAGCASVLNPIVAPGSFAPRRLGRWTVPRFLCVARRHHAIGLVDTLNVWMY
jgi:hypothetical protein